MPPPEGSAGRPKTNYCSAECRKGAQTEQRRVDALVGRAVRTHRPEVIASLGLDVTVRAKCRRFTS